MHYRKLAPIYSFLVVSKINIGQGFCGKDVSTQDAEYKPRERDAAVSKQCVDSLLDFAIERLLADEAGGLCCLAFHDELFGSCFI